MPCGTLHLITSELLNLIDKQRNSGNNVPGDGEALPRAVPEFACICLYIQANWQKRSRTAARDVVAGAGSLLSLEGGPPTDDLTGTTATSGF